MAVVVVAFAKLDAGLDLFGFAGVCEYDVNVCGFSAARIDSGPSSAVAKDVNIPHSSFALAHLFPLVFPPLCCMIKIRDLLLCLF